MPEPAVTERAELKSENLRERKESRAGGVQGLNQRKRERYEAVLYSAHQSHLKLHELVERERGVWGGDFRGREL